MAKRKKVPNSRPDAERRLRQADRLGRILRVLQLIQGRGRYNSREIAEAIECSERTVYRDLQALAMAGIPYYRDEQANCIRIRPGWQFPILNLTTDELLGQAVAAAVNKSPGLDAAGGARPTTEKLTAVSSDEKGKLLQDAERLVAVLDLKLADHSRHREIIKTIQWALLQKKQLVGQYVSPYQAKPVKLTLEPYRLCLVHQAWYLIAKSASAATPHTYRITRFQTLRSTDTSAVVPEDFDLRAYFGNAWAVFRGKETFDVELLFSADAAPLVQETNWHPTQKAKPQRDGSVVLSFQVDGLEEILWWVLGWSSRVKVIAPGQLRQMVLEKLQAAVVMNSESASASSECL